MLPIRFVVRPDSHAGVDQSIMWDVLPISAELTLVNARPSLSSLSITLQDGSDAVAQLQAGGEIAVEVQRGEQWQEIPNARFCATGYTIDQVARTISTSSTLPANVTSTFTPTLQAMSAFRLGSHGAVVWSHTPLSDLAVDKRATRVLGPATAGAIWNRLRTEVQAAGYCSGLDLGVDETQDDNGNPWQASNITRTYDVGTPLADVIDDMTTKGDAKFSFNGVHLTMVNQPQNTNGATVAVLKVGAELLTASYTRDQSQLVTGVVAVDDNGLNQNNVVTTPTPTMAWGKRQAAVRTSGNTTAAQVTAKAQNYLSNHDTAKVSVTADVNLDAGAVPFVDYTLGDRVQVLLADGPADTRRVKQIDLSIDGSGQSATLTFDYRRSLPQEWIVTQLKRRGGSHYGVTDIG